MLCSVFERILGIARNLGQHANYNVLCSVFLSFSRSGDSNWRVSGDVIINHSSNDWDLHLYMAVSEKEKTFEK